jgi:L-histidine Nalpha-methyltransferase
MEGDPTVMEQMQVLRRLAGVLESTDFDWSFCMVGEDQSRKLAELNSDLKRPFSSSGDGKKIVSGYSYWGVEPTIAWQQACYDPYYPVMKDGLASFSQRWLTLRETVSDRKYHYLSLGPGMGEKDGTVLTDLHRNQPGLLYVPVDLSAEMLRVCLRTLRSLPLSGDLRGQTLPVQLDFAAEDNLIALDEVRDRLIGDEPVMFSLLGNTMANFIDDIDLVDRLSRHLMRPDDRLLVEVATTPRLNQDAAAAAALEYGGSKAFGEFVTSALHQHTDLSINMDSVVFEGAVEEGRALQVKIFYRNPSETESRLTLADRSEVPFRPGDSVRLYLTRKYHPKTLAAELGRRGFRIEDTAPSTSRGSKHHFGLELLLLARDANPLEPAVEALFRRH